MFNRPRCRDWTALATQQLRLRNLIQISGHNIVCEPKCSIYFTLHLTSMSAPFFTSEKLESYKNAIWPEINCQSIVKSTSHSVCIRVWQRTQQTADSDTAVDKVLFLWGVYFSGLVPISKRTDVKLNENSLVFHIHGGFFTSTNCLEPDSVYKQLQFIGVIETKKSLQQNSNLNCDAIVLSSEELTNLRGKAKDDSPDVYASPRNGHHNHNHDSNEVPDKVIKYLYSNPESLKVRYIEKNFFKTEIRLSYNVDKLLLLQEKQRTMIKKSASAKELVDKICMRSAFCLNLELIANKAMLYRPRGNPSMGRTLNRLLFQQPEQPKPEILLQAQELRRRIETAKFRCRLLVQERNQAKIKLRQLEHKLGTISDANIEQEAWLMANYRGLAREKDAETKSIMNIRDQNENLIKMVKALDDRRHHLLRELKEIYCIKRRENAVFMINGAALPNFDTTSSDVIPPLEISVALGYAAHITLMCSIVLNCPLRNPIIYKGSASRIRDNVKNLSDHEREFPLYCRNSFWSEPLQYAIYLLNQNIAQMKFHLSLHKIDLRTTLSNLLDLLDGPPPSAMVDRLKMEPQQSSVSGSSVDLKVLVPMHQMAASPVGEKRICRSVGSYTDEPIGNSKSNFSSEPILNAGQVQLSNFKNDSVM
ncbi:hypothetical protein HA402_011108 [Bradysia odoriphaga]|nr:hypothetical protein HA402_011108 [Bradysia odoriphaga]